MPRPLSKKDYRDDLAALSRCLRRVTDDGTLGMHRLRKIAILERLNYVITELNQYNIESFEVKEIEDNGED